MSKQHLSFRALVASGLLFGIVAGAGLKFFWNPTAQGEVRVFAPSVISLSPSRSPLNTGNSCGV